MEKKQQVEKTLSRDEASAKRVQYGTDRRGLLTGLTGAAAFLALDSVIARADVTSSPVNIARVASASASRLRSENKLASLNDGFNPESSSDRSHGLYSLFVDEETTKGDLWVQYDWSKTVSINKVEVYWAM
ncbi:MAG TPA: hypothetical protein VIW67_01375, partial [Terriglobales bacterium]